MIYTIKFYVAKIFNRDIYNAMNKKIFVWLFIYLEFVWLKKIYIDQAIDKIVRTIFYISITLFISIDTAMSIRFYSMYFIIVVTADRNDSNY